MANFQIYRLRENLRNQFRWAPHTIGVTIAKRKEYDPVGPVEGPSAYAIWIALKDTENPLQIGDILEDEGGELKIYKYVGFEEARWFIPEGNPSEPAAPANALA